MIIKGLITALMTIALSTSLLYADDEPAEIIGGEIASDSYEFFGALMMGPVVTCGSVLIDKEWALTAGHCVDHIPPHKTTRLVFNLHDKNNPDSTVIKTVYKDKFISLYEPPSFAPPTNDIALIKLDEEVPFDPLVIPETDAPPFYVPGEMAKAMGFGRISVTERIVSDVLREVELPILSDEACWKQNQYPILLKQAFCAGSLEDSLGVGPGDSGSPIIQEINGKTYVLGITVRLADADKKILGVFKKTAYYKDWIDSVIAAHSSTSLPDPQENPEDAPFRVTQDNHELIFQRGGMQGKVNIQGYDLRGREVFTTELPAHLTKLRESTGFSQENSLLLIRAVDARNRAEQKKIILTP